MASTITVPSLPQIQTNPAEQAKQLIAVATAASTDIAALQATTTASDWKNSCLLASDATIANLSSVTVADFDGTAQGITLAAGDRVLIRNNASPDGIIATHGKYQGIYVVGTVATGTAPLTRATDADSSAEVTSGMAVTVNGGTYAGKDFLLTTADPITLGTTALTFTVIGLGVIPTPTAAAKILYDNGTTYVETAAGTAAQIPVINAGATAPVFVSLSGDVTITAAGVATVAAATAAAAGKVSLVAQMGAVRTVRGVVTANVADLAAFTVAGNDGLTYAAGERVLLAAQTTTTQDGIYVVGTVGGGTAPLTRATDMAAASVQPAGMEIAVNEGTLFGNTKWFSSLAGANAVATSSPAFYPRKYVRVTTAMAGAPGTKALSSEWILSATKSTVTPTVITPGTQGFLSIGSLTPGAGSGSFTVTSTANETSTLQIVIEN